MVMGTRAGLVMLPPHYATMTLEEIKNLPVPKIAAKDLILFLWATFPNLCEALEVIKAWGDEVDNPDIVLEVQK